MIRLAVVDDQAIVRAGLARILSPADGFEVVAECADGQRAVEELPAVRPDVILMDVRMPGLDGIAATAQLRDAPDPVPVLVLTTFGEDEVLWGAIEAGAAGFVLKDSEPALLVDAVRAAAKGQGLLDPQVTRRTIRRFAELAPRRAPSGPDRLTPREHEVLRLVARGMSNAEIAVALTVGEGTVKTHVARVLAKLGLRTRVHLVIHAYEHGLLEDP